MPEDKTPQDDDNGNEAAHRPGDGDADANRDEDAVSEATATPGDAKTAADAAEPPADDAAPTADVDAADDTPAPRRSRVGLALAALLVVAAAAAGGWWWLQRDNAPGDGADDTTASQPAPTRTADRTAPAREPAPEPAPRETLIPPATKADVDALRDDIAALQAELSDTRDTLRSLDRSVDAAEDARERLEDRIDSRGDLLDSLPGRVQNLEQSVETLQGISAGSRDSWLLAEAEYYMQIANAQLQLANNPDLAARALRLADQRVRELANPAYTPVRRAISDELAALSATTEVDIEGVTLTLGSIAAMVPGLPLDNDVVLPDGGDGSSAVDELSGWERARAATREALSGMVRVRRSGERVQAMLPPEAEYFLRLNVQLQLQAARLSLLLGDAAGFGQSLDDASEWLERYFDGEDPSVQNALDMIASAADTTVVTSRPDISGSLALLRRQRTLERAGE